MKYLALALAILLAAFLLMPSPVNSIARTYSEPMALENQLAVNEKLQASLIGYLPDGLAGGEDIDRDQQGCAVIGIVSGEILKNCDENLTKDKWQTIINTNGRPLGLHYDSQGNLIIADAIRGLLKLSSDNKLEVLVDSYQGEKLLFTDDVDIAQDGTIYFTDASTLFGVWDYTLDALSGHETGRLYSYQPETKQLTLLIKDMAFANGVALSADDSFILINESWQHKVTRLWLKGDNSGQVDTFIDRLPGIPDGISRGPDGSFWLAIHGPRSGLLEAIAGQPLLKNLAAKVPPSLTPHPDKYGMVINLDVDGNIRESFQDPAAVGMWNITSVHAVEEGFYMGTLNTDRVGFYKF